MSIVVVDEDCCCRWGCRWGLWLSIHLKSRFSWTENKRN